MSNDTSLPVRRAILTLLKNSPAVTALVPADRIYPPQTPPLPDWPFIRFGSATQLPFLASGMDGSTIVAAVHCFAKGPGDDAVAAIGAAVAWTLDKARLPLEGGGTAYVRHDGNQTLPDPAEASAWHVVCNVRVDCSV